MSTQVALKKELIDAIAHAEKLAFEYFRQCDVGQEREAAGQVYENIRTATRIGK